MADLTAVLLLAKEYGPWIVIAGLMALGWFNERKRVDAIQERRITEARETLPALSSATEAVRANTKSLDALSMEVRNRP
tara:strand:+ start:1039 stop:1275 length:237 start_codon:yes stop_codon:yes gene_type:complete